MASQKSQRPPSYKEISIQQLRDLIETAKQGSQVAAARALGVSQATVWEQLHALQRALGAKLITSHGRGCRLTADGDLLVRIAAPLVEALDQLPSQFHQQRGEERQLLRIAATPRTLTEDISLCVVEFEKQFPHVQIELFEAPDNEASKYVESGKADLGFTPSFARQAAGRWLEFQSGYDVDQFLITPADHPLARKRVVRPEDILQYPSVNGPGTFYGERMQLVEAQLEATSSHPRRVFAYSIATVRKLVKLGFGVGIVPCQSKTHQPDPDLHERSIGKYVGLLHVNIVLRRGAVNPLVESFKETIHQLLADEDQNSDPDS